jgi:uncharacterized Zn-finger protein
MKNVSYHALHSSDEHPYCYADLAHTCPHPDCHKGFSRYDNLRQHLRVHKDYVFDKGDVSVIST